MESLQAEIAAFGINTTLVNPGFIRTELISKDSMTPADLEIDDYKERREQQMQWWTENNGKQPGDPARVAQAIIQIASVKQPPRRFIAGADAVGLAKQKVAELQAQIDSYPELSASMAYNGK